MKVLVTGGAGFIGSHIVDKLIAEGHEVVVADNLSTGSIQNINPGANFYQVDITDSSLIELFHKEKPEVVIHHAAQVDVQLSQKEPVFDLMVNALGTVNVLNCCKAVKARKIICASSAAVYGTPEYLPIDEIHPVKPISNYGISKYSAEQYIHAYHQNFGLSYTIFRYANVYGPRQGLNGEGGVIYLFAKSFLAGESPVIYGDGSQTRDFVFVRDIVNANMLALDKGSRNVLNIGSGIRVSVNDLFSHYRKLLSSGLKAQYAEPRLGDIDHSGFNIECAYKALGWRPAFSLAEGLGETLSYYQRVINQG